MVKQLLSITVLFYFTSFYQFLFSNQQDKESFVEFSKVMQNHCVRCHNDKSINNANLILSDKETFIKKKGIAKKIIVKPKSSKKSFLYETLILDRSSRFAMPPADRYKKLSIKEINVIKKWIDVGAPWFKDQEKLLKPKLGKNGKVINQDETELIKKIRKKLINYPKKIENSIYYTNFITNHFKNEVISFVMKKPPSGLYSFDDKNKNNQPISIQLNSFWMGIHEVTWDEYNIFMLTDKLRTKDGFLADLNNLENEVEILARPTLPYHAMSFGMPEKKHPAISMTHHAAIKYTQWLSYITGRFYRLPTEAEWNYVFKNGYKNWNDILKNINKHAWFKDNSRESYHLIGSKLPNQWGFYDLLGNVSEWVLDQYTENRYDYFKEKALENNLLVNPWIRSKKPYPHTTMGGSWNDDFETIKKKRMPSSSDWKSADPQIPKSIWYHTSAPWVGFRLVSTDKIPTLEEMYEYWNNGFPYDDEE